MSHLVTWLRDTRLFSPVGVAETRRPSGAQSRVQRTTSMLNSGQVTLHSFNSVVIRGTMLLKVCLGLTRTAHYVRRFFLRRRVWDLTFPTEETSGTRRRVSGRMRLSASPSMLLIVGHTLPDTWVPGSLPPRPVEGGAPVSPWSVSPPC